jgi:hypothetical protein
MSPTSIVGGSLIQMPASIGIYAETPDDQQSSGFQFQTKRLILADTHGHLNHHWRPTILVVAIGPLPNDFIQLL